jgi:hypothetical protein
VLLSIGWQIGPGSDCQLALFHIVFMAALPVTGWIADKRLDFRASHADILEQVVVKFPKAPHRAAMGAMPPECPMGGRDPRSQRRNEAGGG